MIARQARRYMSYGRRPRVRGSVGIGELRYPQALQPGLRTPSTSSKTSGAGSSTAAPYNPGTARGIRSPTAPAGLGGPLDDANLRTGPAADAELGDNPESTSRFSSPKETCAPLLTSNASSEARASVAASGPCAAKPTASSPSRTVTTSRRLMPTAISVSVTSPASRSRSHEPASKSSYTSTRPTSSALASAHAARMRNRRHEHWVRVGREPAANLAAMPASSKHSARSRPPPVRSCGHQTSARVPREQFRNWRPSAALLRGEEITGTDQEGYSLTIDLATEITPGEGCLGISLPHTVLVDDQVDLGRYELCLRTRHSWIAQREPGGRHRAHLHYCRSVLRLASPRPDRRLALGDAVTDERG